MGEEWLLEFHMITLIHSTVWEEKSSYPTGAELDASEGNKL